MCRCTGPSATASSCSNRAAGGAATDGGAAGAGGLSSSFGRLTARSGCIAHKCHKSVCSQEFGKQGLPMHDRISYNHLFISSLERSEDAHLCCKGLGRLRARQFRRIRLHAVIVVITRPGLSLCDSSTEHF
jgi:hypothetical protein